MRRNPIRRACVTKPDETCVKISKGDVFCIFRRCSMNIWEHANSKMSIIYMNALLASTLRDVTKCTRSRLLVANYCHGSVPAKISFCQLQMAIKIGELKEIQFRFRRNIRIYANM